MKYDILALFGHFHLKKKIEMNPFTGSTILWSILGEYESLTYFVVRAIIGVRGKKYTHPHIGSKGFLGT